MGSKRRISKYIVPIIQEYINENTTAYIEPFVGGGNIITKIDCDIRIGSDINLPLIELLKHIRDHPNDIPDDITEEEYNNVRTNKDKYPLWYVGLVGFNCTFGGKYYGGYARAIQQNGETRNRSILRNLKKWCVNLQGIEFICCDYNKYDCLENCVIYCDPPYFNTTGYKNKFDSLQFYDWVRDVSLKNTVIVSEYQMPDDFRCIWERDIVVNLDASNNKPRTEKLFVWGV